MVLGLHCLWRLIVASKLMWMRMVFSLFHYQTVLPPQQILLLWPQLFRPLSEP